jgi:hypothetical protein
MTNKVKELINACNEHLNCYSLEGFTSPQLELIRACKAELERLEMVNQVLQGYRNKSAETCGRPFGECIALQFRIAELEAENKKMPVIKDEDILEYFSQEIDRALKLEEGK